MSLRGAERRSKLKDKDKIASPPARQGSAGGSAGGSARNDTSDGRGRGTKGDGVNNSMMRRVFSLLLLSMTTGILLCSCMQAGVTKEQAKVIAREHLQQYGHYTFTVLRVEVEEGEGWSNHYWERFGQPYVEGKKRICWVVSFYYPGVAEGSHKQVFVDKKSGEVIGGTQTK